jgi:hypothetical protein
VPTRSGISDRGVRTSDRQDLTNGKTSRTPQRADTGLAKGSAKSAAARGRDHRERREAQDAQAHLGLGGAADVVEVLARVDGDGDRDAPPSPFEEPRRRTRTSPSRRSAPAAPGDRTSAPAAGARELASDTWIDREGSQRAHEALGFEVVDRCVHYRKALA